MTETSEGPLSTREIGGLVFERTCTWAPEQYDVRSGDRVVAYVRLRWGALTVEMPGPCDELVYVRHFDDRYQGAFPDEPVRTYYLQVIARVVDSRLATVDLESSP